MNLCDHRHFESHVEFQLRAVGEEKEKEKRAEGAQTDREGWGGDPHRAT
jgi:hypothetical protein